MPKDISSSSSGDEEDTHAPELHEKEKKLTKKTTSYQCPAEFVSFCHKPCSSTLTKSLKNHKTELWLIKAPASFNPECFSGVKVPLSGLQTLKVPTGSGQQFYSILASTHGTSELHLLTGDEQSSDAVVFGPAFSGQLNVSESYSDSSANQAPKVIPATPAPSIPLGLKQRFHPFGSKTPTLTCVAESEEDGAAFGPSSATLRPLVAKRLAEETWQEEEEGGKKKKKKKKKEKQIKTECAEEVDRVVKVEPVAEIQDEVMTELPLQVGDLIEEKRKKKKKKKDREREEVEEASVRVKEEDVKCEPVDVVYGEVVEGSAKKKKKKKKNKTDDD